MDSATVKVRKKTNKNRDDLAHKPALQELTKEPLEDFNTLNIKLQQDGFHVFWD
jgi:hypothetical protein